MSDQFSAKRAAKKLMKDYEYFTPNLDGLYSIIKDQGYEIIDYDPNALTESMKMLLVELSIPQAVTQQEAFVYKRQSVKLLFIKEYLSAKEKLYALSHELGHIMCGHLDNAFYSDLSVKQEQEANDFTYYLMHPYTLERIIVLIKHHRIVVFLVILMLLVLAAFSFYPTKGKETIAQRFLPMMGSGYYITSGGSKYHLASCSMIQNRTNVRELTIDELNAGNYEPCQLCLPDYSGQTE